MLSRSACNAVDSALLDFALPDWLGFGASVGASSYHLAAEPDPKADPRARPESATLPHGRGETVLVVDDEAPIRGVLTQMLERYGYRVLTARNGAEAVSVYTQRAGDIAVVLTDMMMPVMDGPAVVQALRKLNPQVKMVGMSGARIGQAKSAEVELAHFIPKPYTTEIVLQTLSRVLRGE